MCRGVYPATASPRPARSNEVIGLMRVRLAWTATWMDGMHGFEAKQETSQDTPPAGWSSQGRRAPHEAVVAGRGVGGIRGTVQRGISCVSFMAVLLWCCCQCVMALLCWIALGDANARERARAMATATATAKQKQSLQ